ncbi:MAG TPA: universal stress protein, partial [Desulfosarcina sp.]|nr:universal stress protein [Desulfosarcina sp.]
AVDPSVLTAARLARQEGAHLYLLHVMEPASLEDRRRVREVESETERVAEAGYAQSIRRSLQQVYRNDLSALPHEIRAAAGFPWEEILRWSAAIDADLIVMGPHSTRAIEKGAVRIAGSVGSTVEHVVTRETCPVMIVNQAADEDRLSFRTVLVPVDFSRSCECAVCFAARLAAGCRSRVLAFHMLPVPPVPKYSRDAYARDRDHAHDRLESLCSPYLDGIEHRCLIRAGAVPHLEILKAAEENQVDLIIMGSHTKETPGKWYPGSAVERVGYRAFCPVVVITDPQVLVRWDDRLAGSEGQDADRLIHVFTAI